MGSLIDLANTDPLTFDVDTFVEEAANKMTELNVGAALVSKNDRVIGIFTERDVLHKMIPNRMAGKSTFVEEIMTEELITIRPDQTATEALALMIDHNIRHLPIKNFNGEVLGMLSLKKVMKHFVKILASSVKGLQKEMEILL